MKQILIVDDELDIAESMASLLESEGFNVRAVYGGPAGVEAMKAKCPDLVVMDVMMPILKGVDVVKLMKNDPHLSKVPILMMSASKEPAKEIGVEWNSFIRKPFDIDELLSEINRLV